ncbi:hypothetical protein KAJ83_09930 [Marivibrio halodurans]|uniref:Uncharacterized protein n=1 Tax=Marivibrio halodurans TaxID=2039722 RepID=A0A8J7RZ19_9PROT|nr:hypothetical protein [Marivibrio halodurans]MBP5857327.1 hypothetical protein [Marivibrio halodurans]
MNKIASSAFKDVFGSGIESKEFWGEDTVKGYRILNKIRNTVLHSATLIVSVDEEIKLNLNKSSDIQYAFEILDFIIKTISERADDIT